MYRYFEDPSTEVLCLSWADDKGNRGIWLPSMLRYAPLWEMVSRRDIRVYAWNAEFDMLCWDKVMRERLGWPGIPASSWYDMMAVAAYRSYPVKLKTAALVIGDSQEKLGSGTRLITKFSKPNRLGEFNQPVDHDRDWAEFLRYCMRDTELVKVMHEKLGDLPAREREVWLHTMTINNRGVYIDAPACRNILHLIDQKREHLNSVMCVKTGGQVTSLTQRERVRSYLAEVEGVAMPNMQDDTIVETISRLEENPALHGNALKILRWYRMANRSSTAKYSKILDQLCKDSRIRGFLFYHGAGTGRYSGRGVQFQNFPRKTVDRADEALDIIEVCNGDLETAELLLGDIITLSKELLRSVIMAPPGRHLCVGDFKSIEAVATSWACGEGDILNAFVRGDDPYRRAAAAMYSVPYTAVTSEQRQAGKVSVLACGFGGYEQAIMNMAKAMGMKITGETARQWAESFRKSRPKLVAAWGNVEKAAREALSGAEGREIVVEGVRGMRMMRIGDDLRTILPSGREINYPGALSHSDIQMRNVYDPVTGDIRLSKRIENMACGCNAASGWIIRPIYGSLLFQNYIQALCRDILVEAQLRLEKGGYDIVINVHDELGALVTNDKPYTFQVFKTLMTRRPKWLPASFPILMEGYIARRYKK